ncbi:hypothetical protein [Streptomyces sp. NPDC016845]|uniref:hypothetical protein n=1 Tax=Streptomyces sp. NPDC016845 TaxID=3364972 RepID=UPI0037A8BA87
MIQRLLETAWPADLPAVQARRLAEQGRRVLLADLTGLGRSAFPTAFVDAEPSASTVVPAFSRIRIQAVIARMGPRPGWTVVHLVWAGADRGGTYTDGRLTDITFRHHLGDDTWIPLPPATA